MNKYSNYSACVKCGAKPLWNDKVSDGVVPHKTEYLAVYHIAGEYYGKEVMKRTCSRCGYTWCEKPLDFEKAQNDNNG